MTPIEDTCLIDSGVSKQMKGQNKTMSKLEENNSPTIGFEPEIQRHTTYCMDVSDSNDENY